MTFRSLNLGVTALLIGGLAVPANAGLLGAPAPVAGVGIGAIVLLGLGYRALRKRAGR